VAKDSAGAGKTLKIMILADRNRIALDVSNSDAKNIIQPVFEAKERQERVFR
jgi:hypothetical protein